MMMKKNTGYALLTIGALLSFSASAADVGKLIEGCVGCHGKGGANTEANIPNIGSFSAEYMTTTLKLYKTKERPCPEVKITSGAKKGSKSDMCQAVKDLSDADIKQIADSFAEQKFVRTPQKFDPVLAKKGKGLHDKLCEKCHSEGGSVASDDSGILAGQKMAYLEDQIKFFNEGKRPVAKKMKPKLEELDKAGIEAIIHYYGSFK